MKAVIDRVEKMSIAQKTIMDRTPTRIAELKTKIEQMEGDLEDTIDTKIEEALEELFDLNKNFKSKF